jgi:hypothetical protein
MEPATPKPETKQEAPTKAVPPPFEKSIIRGAAIIAGPMKIAQFKAFNYTTGEWSSWQYNMAYDNHVMAVMGEQSAKLFAKFITENIGASD